MSAKHKPIVAVAAAIALTTIVGILVRDRQALPDADRQSLPDARMKDLVQLPRPNSGQHTTAQAEARRGELFRLKPTSRLSDWVDPEYGTGFCVHINNHDELEVNHFSMRFESANERRIRDGLEKVTGDRYFENLSQHHGRVTLAKLEGMISMVTMFNQPAFVVLTSERPVTHSKVFPDVLDRLFQPAVMLHYVPQTITDRTSRAVQPLPTVLFR